MNDFKIINEARISDYYLDESLDSIVLKLQKSKVDYESINTNIGVKILSSEFIFFFDKKNTAYQITCLTEAFTFLKDIKVGDFIPKLIKEAGEIIDDDLFVIKLKDYKGICFDIEEIDEEDEDPQGERWQEYSVITAISVYNADTFK